MSNIIMIDLETLSTAPNAAILSIGAVCFSLDGPPPDEGFLVSVDRGYYDMQSEFDVDPQTEAWWAKQGRAAQDSLKINRKSTLPLALDEFGDWCGMQGDVDYYMAKPAAFDFPILENAGRHSYGRGDVMPWKHRQRRCFSTYGSTFADEYRAAQGVVYPELVRHRADHDAVRQAVDMQYIHGAIAWK